MQTFKKLIC